MTGEDVARMGAQILNGIAKEDSPLVKDKASSAAWDELVEYFEANPGVEWEIPSEYGQTL